MTPYAKIRNGARVLVEAVARIIMGEPARVVPERKIRRLDELERRWQLQAAEHRGDLDYLRAELAKAQLTSADLDRLAKLATPIEEWPVDDLDRCFTPASESLRPRLRGR